MSPRCVVIDREEVFIPCRFIERLLNPVAEKESVKCRRDGLLCVIMQELWQLYFNEWKEVDS